MTQKKKFKRAVRERAAKRGTSYSTARQSMASDKGDNPAPKIEDAIPAEEIPAGLHRNIICDPLTIHLRWKGDLWRLGSVMQPPFAVAYAVLGSPDGSIDDLEAGKPRVICFARKTREDESGWDAYNKAIRQYPKLDWKRTSGCDGVTHSNGAPALYWVQWLIPKADGKIVWERGRHGLRSLDDVLSGKLGPLDDPAGPPPA